MELVEVTVGVEGEMKAKTKTRNTTA